MAKKKSVTRDNITKSLIEQLQHRGIEYLFLTDLINDYGALWTVKQKLIDDIEKRGVTVEYQNGKNQKGLKQNDSVLSLIKTNAQMLRILAELGLRGAEQVGMVEEEL